MSVQDNTAIGDGLSLSNKRRFLQDNQKGLEQNKRLRISSVKAEQNHKEMSETEKYASFLDSLKLLKDIKLIYDVGNPNSAWSFDAWNRLISVEDNSNVLISEVKSTDLHLQSAAINSYIRSSKQPFDHLYAKSEETNSILISESEIDRLCTKMAKNYRTISVSEIKKNYFLISKS